MKLYRSILGIEFKQVITVMNVILLSVFFLIAMYFTQDGISKYKGILKEIEDFKKIERQKIERYKNYQIYGSIGFRVVLQPPPVSIFFSNSGLSIEQYANLNIDERLNIESSIKGKNINKGRLIGNVDFPGILLLAGSFICIFYGFKSFCHREYFKTLAGLKGEKGIYFHIIVARFSLIALFFLITMISGIMLAILNGIAFTGSDYILLLKFSATSLLLFFVSFIIGTAISAMRDKEYGTVFIMIIWASYVIFIPFTMLKITDFNAQSMPTNVLIELENWNAQEKFEQRAIKELGKYSKEKALSPEAIILAKSFLAKEYKEIQETEKKVEKGMKDNSNLYHGLSAFTPGTFFLSMTNELSGRGYDNVVDFFNYAQNLKDNFAKFYVEKEYPPTNKKVESFIKGEENVYKAVSHVPGTYWPGMGIMTVYAFLLTWLSVRRFHNYIFHVSVKPPTPTGRKNESVNLARGKYSSFKIDENRLRDYLYSVFSGKILSKTKMMMNIPVRIDNEDITSKPRKYSFMFICSPDALPHDIRVDDFFNLVLNLLDLSPELAAKSNVEKIKSEYIGNLSKTEKFNLLLILPGLVKRDIYLFDNEGIGNTLEMYANLNRITNELTAQNSIVICLTENSGLSFKESLESSEFFEHSIQWKSQLETAVKMHTVETGDEIRQ